jgi:replicative DNA helicase
MMSRPSFVAGADAAAAWRDAVRSGIAPVLYPVGGPGWSAIEIGPGLITLLGGAPGSGKTALALQLIFEALGKTPDLRAVIANVEMTAAVLLDRQLARQTAIPVTDIRFRRFDQDAIRVKQGMKQIEAIAERIAFLKPPFSLENVAATADDFGADLLVLDYIQRFTAPR